MANTKKKSPAKNSSSKSGQKTPAKSNTKKKTQSSSKQVQKSGTSKNQNAAPKRNNPVNSVSSEVSERNRKRAFIIILSAIAVLFLAATLIKGENVWLAIHNGFFGLFGITAYVWPLMMIYLAIVIATNRRLKSAEHKIAETSAFVVLLSGIIHIFSDAALSGSIGVQIKTVWSLRENVIDSAGGICGAIFGGIPLMLFGKAAASIVMIVLLIVVFLFVTEGTFLDVIPVVKNLFRKASERKQAYDENDFSEQEDEEENRNRNKKKPYFTDDFDESVEDGMFIEELVGNQPKKKLPENKKTPRPFIDITTGEVIDTAGKTAGVNTSFADTTADDIDAFLNIANKKQNAPKMQEKKTSQPKPEVKVVKKKEEKKEEEKKQEEPKQEELKTDSTAEFKPVYRKPDASILAYANNPDSVDYEEELKNKATKLVETLNSFGVSTKIVGICRGPSVTRFELQPAAGVKISRITSLADDLALALASTGVRMEAPIPNKSAVGIEVPNKNRSTVSLREIVETPTFQSAKSKLNVALGKDIAGNTICADIAKMPHLLIAGTTGSGKSVCLNAMIVSILLNANPDEVKLVMIDPKQVEFTVYNGIPHLLVPVVSDPRKAAGALGWAVTEMLQRYKMFSEKAVRDIKGYNRLAENDPELTPMPHIVIFIDELSDLMMAAPNEVEDSICRLAQMARAAGMHLVIATQRPSVNVITGIIKANIPSRIALSVSSQVDSRTILDAAGAEKLLGNGDMLFGPVGTSKPIRVQGCFLSDEEVEDVVRFIKNQGAEEKTYDEDVMKEIENQEAQMGAKKASTSAGGAVSESDGEEGADEMLPKAIEVVVEAQMASTTLLQRKLKLGYARAARIVDELEQRKIVGPFEGSKPRKVLITKQQWMEMNALGNASASIENPIAENVDFDEFDDYETDDDDSEE